MDADVKALSDLLVNEILNALALPKSGGLRQTFAPIFAKATERLSSIGATFDRIVSQSGFAKASEWALTNFVRGVTARGEERIPSEGPLLVVSNHPGAYDSLVITSHLKRDDIKIITSDIPFLQKLPHAYSHFINTTLNTHNRMAGARAAIRHMQAGGAVLLFGSGSIDPDPAIYPNAEEHLDEWSPSIELFLRLVPEARLLLSMVSGVLSKYWGYHPITWLRRGGVNKRRLAEFGQVIQQMLTGAIMPGPSISFAPPLTAGRLHKESDGERLMPAVITRSKALLSEHTAWATR